MTPLSKYETGRVVKILKTKNSIVVVALIQNKCYLCISLIIIICYLLTVCHLTPVVKFQRIKTLRFDDCVQSFCYAIKLLAVK